MMNVANLILVLLDLDKQCVTPRPSSWGRAAELVKMLAVKAGIPDDWEYSGDWKSIDLSDVHRQAPAELLQPHVDALLAGDAERELWIPFSTARPPIPKIPRIKNYRLSQTVLIATPTNVLSARWCEDEQSWFNSGILIDFNATHWRPLPKHPTLPD